MDESIQEFEVSSSESDNSADLDYYPEKEPRPARKRITEKYSEEKMRKVYDHYQSVKKTKLVSTVKKFKSLTSSEVNAIRKHFEANENAEG